MNYLLLYLIVGLPVSVMCALVATATDTPPVKRVVVGLLFWSVWPIFPVVLIREKLMLRHIRTVCAWCGEVVGEYDKTKWCAHLLECPKHPLREQITALRERNADLEARLDIDYPPHTVDPRVSEQAARIEALEDALRRIVTWSEAYPLAVFPEPDFQKAHDLLLAGGMTLDAISASNMRHAVEGGLLTLLPCRQAKCPYLHTQTDDPIGTVDGNGVILRRLIDAPNLDAKGGDA